MLILFFFFKQIESFDLSISSGIIPLQDVRIRVQGPVPLPKLQDQNHTSWWPLYFASSACQWRHQGDWFLWISSSYLNSSNAGTRTPGISNQTIPNVHSGARLLWVFENYWVTSRWLDGHISDKCLVPLSRIRQDFSRIWGCSCELEPSRPQSMRCSL